MCKPPTILYNKVTIKDARQSVQMFGPAQHSVAMAVADSVAEGVIPANEADDLFITVGVFIHWEAKDDQKIQDFNYRATKEAIARAIKGEPKASEVTAKKDSAHHPWIRSQHCGDGAPRATVGSNSGKTNTTLISQRTIKAKKKPTPTPTKIIAPARPRR